MLDVSEAVEEVVEEVEVQTCCHHWEIEPAEGPVSLGVCRLCHESKEFKNSIDTYEAPRPTQGQTPANADTEA